jgi:tetratricopeptide (TPR) repeat protein
MKWTSIVVAILALSACGSQTTPANSTAPAAIEKPAPPAEPPPSYGRHSHPIQTKSAEAQPLFDRGMAQAFGFNHEAAIRSFERASEVDPSAPMPHWGRAWALGPNYNLDIDDTRAQAAYDAITKAKSLASQAPEAERAYIDALAVRYSPDMKADRAALSRKYSQAMGELSRRYPDDLDLATLYVESLMILTPWKLWTLDGKPAANTGQIVARLEDILARNPNHLGANHYYIHAIEASPAPARALPSAMRMKALAEQSGHLLHMPAHIYGRTGDHAAAADANAAGAEADRKYLLTAPPTDFYGMAYYSHNLHFLADSNMMQGRLADAQQAARRLVEHLNPHAAMMPMIESMIVMEVSVLMRFNRSTDILALTAPPADRPVQLAWHHFARGVALARTGKIDEAAAEQKILGEAIRKVPESALFGGTGLASASTVFEVAALVLDARIASARQQHDRAIKTYRQAIAIADKLPYDEPPVWFYPLRESLGAELLANNQPDEAARVFREDLVRHPRNARALFGLQASLAKQGKEADAAWVEREFNDAWKNADTKLSIGDL